MPLAKVLHGKIVRTHPDVASRLINVTRLSLYTWMKGVRRRRRGVLVPVKVDVDPLSSLCSASHGGFLALRATWI